MSNDSSRDTRRDFVTAAGAVGLGAIVSTNVAAAAQIGAQTPRARRRIGAGTAGQDGEEIPRSRRISEEVVVGSSVARSPDYDEAKKHALIQVIEHVFREEEDTAAGYPVTRVKEFKVKAATKLAIVTIGGFEAWFGTKEQELVAASSRYGVHAGLDADFRRGTLTVKVRANSRFWGKVDRDWTWRCGVVVQCFGEV
jgi:hypothetical protein